MGHSLYDGAAEIPFRRGNRFTTDTGGRNTLISPVRNVLPTRMPLTKMGFEGFGLRYPVVAHTSEPTETLSGTLRRRGDVVDRLRS